MRRLQKEITKLIVEDDAFGLKDGPYVTNSLIDNIDYASTQVNITDSSIIDHIWLLQQAIDQDDILKLEEQSHITIRYGLLPTVTAEQVEWIISQHWRIRVKLGSLSLFQNDKQDVLKVEVESKDLEDINRHLGIVPNTQTFRDYHPHLTVAYLKPGTGQKYVGTSGLEGTELIFESMVFSNVERRHTEIVFNVFCPTGKGGGVDPTCSPGGSSAAKVLTSDEREAAAKNVLQQLSDMEDAGTDMSKEYDGLSVAYQALAGGRGFSVAVYSNDKVVAAGSYTVSVNGKGVVEYIGSSQKGAGSQVMSEILSQLKEEGVKEVLADASPAAIGLNKKFGFQVAGKLTPNGTPMKLVFNTLTNNAGIWRWLSTGQKLQEFMDWVRLQMSTLVLGKMTKLGTTDPDHWLTKYIEDTFRKGMSRAYDSLKKPGLATKLDFYRGTKEEFLRSSFMRPVSIERVKLLASRSFNELQGVTDAMATQMQRTLTDGFIRGENPLDLARNLSKDVSGIGIKRARTIARTEVIRAHNEGQLEAMEGLGAEEVGVAVEWSTSGLGVTKRGNPSPCKVCAPLKGIVMSIKEARGLLPRHPSCMCSWVPANVGEKTTEQIRTRDRIQSAVDKSILAERSKKRSLAKAKKKSSWAGVTKKFSKKRPKSIL